MVLGCDHAQIFFFSKGLISNIYIFPTIFNTFFHNYLNIYLRHVEIHQSFYMGTYFIKETYILRTCV